MKLSEKQLLVLTIIIPAIIAVVLAVGGYFVFYKQSSRLKSEVETIAKKTKEATAKRDEMWKLEERLKELEDRTKTLEAMLPSTEEIAYENFINTVTKLTREAGVRLTSATYDEGKSGPQQVPSAFERISYKLKIQGDFAQVISFIYFVETYLRFIKVDNFSVTPQMGEKTVNYLLDVKLTTYVYKQPK